MKSYHLMDSIWGLVLGTGLQVFNVILAVNFFKNLPPELEEACYIDGGGPWRNLISICIPLAKPMVATIALFTMVMYWNEFFQGMVLSTRQSSYPLQTYIQQMVVTLDYSTMNVEQIAQAMKLNNPFIGLCKNIYSYDTGTDRLSVPAKIFCRGYYTGISKRIKKEEEE